MRSGITEFPTAAITELLDGVRLESDNGMTVEVETAQLCIRVTSRLGKQSAYSCTRNGMQRAAELIERAGRIFKPRAPLASHAQGELFRAVPWVPGDEPEARKRVSTVTDVETVLSAALRRSASRRWRFPVALSDVEASVARIKMTPLVYALPNLPAPWLAADIIRFRAAAVAFANAERTFLRWARVEDVPALMAPLMDWRATFSPERLASRAVHKTLALYGEDGDPNDLWALRCVRLERPVQSALHLALLGERVRVGSRDKAMLHDQLRLIQHADEDELRALAEESARHLGGRPRTEHHKLHLLAEMLNEMADVVTDRGLRGVLGQRQARPGHRRRPVWLRADEKTALPPIPVPQDEGVRFLETVQDVISEGESMDHCIGTRSFAAVRGDAFLFHVEHCGSRASVQLNARGVIVELQGPGNQQSHACTYAAAVFERWGRRLRGEPAPAANAPDEVSA